MSKAIQLIWSNWDGICDFVPKPHFIKGVYLDNKTFNELPNGHTSNTIGFRLKISEGTIVVREGDYVVKDVVYNNKGKEVVKLIYQYIPRKVLTERTKIYG